MLLIWLIIYVQLKLLKSFYEKYPEIIICWVLSVIYYPTIKLWEDPFIYSNCTLQVILLKFYAKGSG